MPPRVLITGANGLLGRHCLPLLTATGWVVHALGRGVSSCDGVVGHVADLLTADPEPIVAAIRPTHLLHLAWITTPGTYPNAAENRDWVTASLRVLRAFGNHGGRRAVFAGTCAEYDGAAGMCREFETPLRSATVYAACKDELRQQAGLYAEAAGVSLAWGRVFIPYGPGEHPDRLVPAVACSLLRGVAVDCTEGRQRRDFVHAADVAGAFVQLLSADLNGPVNIGSGSAVAVRDVILTVANLLGRPDLVRLGARPMPPGEPPLLVADTARLRAATGWRPRFTLNDGLADAVAWWRRTYARTA